MHTKAFFVVPGSLMVLPQPLLYFPAANEESVPGTFRFCSLPGRQFDCRRNWKGPVSNWLSRPSDKVWQVQIHGPHNYLPWTLNWCWRVASINSESHHRSTQPKNVRGLKSYLGLSTYYSKFLLSMSTVFWHHLSFINYCAVEHHGTGWRRNMSPSKHPRNCLHHWTSSSISTRIYHCFSMWCFCLWSRGGAGSQTPWRLRKVDWIRILLTFTIWEELCPNKKRSVGVRVWS